MAGQMASRSQKFFGPTLDEDTYKQMYQQSIENPDKFWSEQATRFVSWSKPWKTVSEWDFTTGQITWFKNAKLNVCYNCLDRHLPEHAAKVAFYWEGDNAHRRQAITYQQLFDRVCRFANVLKSLKVKKGDRVAIYMPMIPDAIVAMLACARIGAIHSVVFGGFSPTALAGRIRDAGCKIVITVDESLRGGKYLPGKTNVDEALKQVAVQKVLVIKNSGAAVPMRARRDLWYHELARQQNFTCPPEEMDAEDPLFILYTSGSTGKPKGVVHTGGGYLVYVAITMRYVFDYQPQEVYWCTADIGWVTGHSYIVYGPLAIGATSVMYEGVPTAPNPNLIWEMIDRYQVNIFYTAPTTIRTFMAMGEAPLKTSERNSLRVLGTVGEPINPEAWRWYHESVGKKRCWIVDTWWQTETGGVMIAPLPRSGAQKPGSVSKPFFGIKPEIINDKGEPLAPNGAGLLVIKNSWPGQLRTVYHNPERFLKGYFQVHPGVYFTGDGAHVDDQGDYWISGRVDDVINVSGHRLGTAEIESALVQHRLVAEAAVVGVPHPVKGECVYAFVTLIENKPLTPSLVEELQKEVVQTIGKLAVPDKIQWAPKLPKTRSGKIMRRILRCIATGELDKIGDVSTLAEPEAVSELIKQREKIAKG